MNLSIPPMNLQGSEILKKLPPEVLRIFQVFGDDVRLVGGAVRDLAIQEINKKNNLSLDFINHKNIDDFDFACIFTPDKIQRILTENNIKSIPTGINYGTITAVIGNYNIQITTLRTDINQQGRECQVNFTDNFLADAVRRDFTINALYLDQNGRLYDYFDGIKDLIAQKVRFIGDPATRIQEDFLRILRFFRFSSYYAKNFDEDGLKNVLYFQKSLKLISKERIREEFYKIINCRNKNNVIKTLTIFNDNQTADILWNCPIDLGALKNLASLSLQNYQNNNNNVKIATLFLDKDFDLKQFFSNFKCPNLEKKFLIKVQNYLKDFPQKISQESPDDNDLKNYLHQLLMFEDKNFVIDYCLIIFAKNYLTIAQNYLENIISYIIKLNIPSFIIKISDLENISCPKNKLNNTYKALKILWSQTNFKMSRQELLIEAKKILSANNFSN